MTTTAQTQDLDLDAVLDRFNQMVDADIFTGVMVIRDHGDLHELECRLDSCEQHLPFGKLYCQSRPGKLVNEAMSRKSSDDLSILRRRAFGHVQDTLDRLNLPISDGVIRMCLEMGYYWLLAQRWYQEATSIRDILVDMSSPIPALAIPGLDEELTLVVFPQR